MLRYVHVFVVGAHAVRDGAVGVDFYYSVGHGLRELVVMAGEDLSLIHISFSTTSPEGEILYLCNGRSPARRTGENRFPGAALACIPGPYSRALHQPALLCRACQTTSAHNILNQMQRRRSELLPVLFRSHSHLRS